MSQTPQNFMKSIVVMPTLKRPEFLALALESIDRAEQSPEDIRIYVDHTDEKRLSEVEYVRDTYLPYAMVFHAKEHISAPSGCWNILNSYKEGYESGADVIFFIEEDVRIRPDYFTWNFEVHAEKKYFATCGRYIKRFGNNYFTNPGASFRRESLGLVVPHICDDFFADRRGYLTRTFGKFEEASDLDDGLIRHVQRSVNGIVKYPDQPKAVHQGFWFYGKNEEYRTVGSIQERIDQLRELVKRVDPKTSPTRDFEPF